MLFAQYMCCSPSMEVQIEETETETDVYVTAIADGRTRFHGEVRVRPIFGFSAYGSQFST